jgi:hypothetical protein
MTRSGNTISIEHCFGEPSFSELSTFRKLMNTSIDSAAISAAVNDAGRYPQDVSDQNKRLAPKKLTSYTTR